MGARASRLKESIAYSWNPDHRHDEEHERVEDRARAAICDSHRFGSFADVQAGNDLKWYVEGHDYFYAVSEILENAKDSIFIADWWLSPELYLRRPPAENERWRLDRVLLRKAQQGVRIFIIVYKEENTIAAMSMSSAHTKHALEALHEGISVIRHPDHLGGEVTLLWSHHKKVLCIDSVVAGIGGLDLCFGRYDTANHQLADAHPTDFSRTMYPGGDYNNARVQDFTDVDKWVSNQTSRLDTARMPWHDISALLVGPSVLDVAQLFIESWNFICHMKYRHDDRYPMLAFPHVGVNGEPPEPLHIVRHPHWERLKPGVEGLLAFTRHAKPPQDPEGIDPHGGLGPKGNMKCQILRSAADWSHGVLPEHSILNAYIQLINEAVHHIYIENQFFVTATHDKGVVKNLIGKAIASRVLSAARAGKRFKVVIVIPAVPGFAGDLVGNSSTLAIMEYTYRSLCRGGDSIFEVIEREGFNPHEYISVYNLRSYDRINADPARLRDMAQASGDMDFHKAQVALSRVFLGRDALPSELEKNKTVTYALAAEGGELVNMKSDTQKKEAAKMISLPLPQSYDEALDQIRRFEQAGASEPKIADSVAHHCLMNTGSLMDEPWTGTEDSERDAYVTEELYIHSKIMIVDDRRVIMGSANINERSQLGDRDAEVAMVVEDLDMIDSTMNGEPYKAARFAATLRRRLYRGHLGLIEPQHCPPDPSQSEPVTAAMRAIGVPPDDVTNSAEDQIVADPLSDELNTLLKSTGDKNAELFEDVFHCVPSNKVRTWKQYNEYVPQYPIKVGHVATKDMPVQHIKSQLDQIRGSLVTMPLNFLDQENLLANNASVNRQTMAIYV